MRHEPHALDQFIARMQCVPRFVAARNAQWGRPLGTESLEDVVQDVLAVVWRKLSAFQGQAGLETWVYQFCEFEMRNAVRRLSTRRSRSLTEVEEPTAPPGAPVAIDDDLAPIYVAMENLAPEDTRIIRLKHFEEQTFDGIAASFGWPTNTVKTRYYRALERLKQWLAKERQA